MKYYSFDPKITKKDLEQGQAVSNAFWNACSMILMNEKEKEMAKAKYDVGDILTWCNDGECYATAVIVSSYMSDYDLFIKPKGDDYFRFIRDVPEMVFSNYKVVGHIDISGMPNEEIETELAYAIAYVWNEHEIAYAVQAAHWMLMKLHEPKEEDKYVKKEIYIPKMTDENCCYDGRDKLEKENRQLKEECKQKQKHLDLANNKILELKKEVDSLRQMLRNDSTRIHKNLSEMGFTEDAICSIWWKKLEIQRWLTLKRIKKLWKRIRRLEKMKGENKDG